MIRFSSIVAILILSLCAFGVFQLKFYVQNLRKDIKELSNQLELEKDSIHVLKAEWTYLNQPDRLRQLTKRHLQLDVIKVAQMHKLENGLPLYLAEDNNKRDAYFASLESAKNRKGYHGYYKNNEMVKAVKYKVEDKLKPQLTKVKY